MATEILNINQLEAGAVVTTSDFFSEQAHTDQESVRVSLADSVFAVPFFSTVLYPYDGVVELCGIGELIERHFRLTDSVAKDVVLTFNEATVGYKFVYCERMMPPDFDAEKSLLVSSETRIVHRGGRVFFPMIGLTSEGPFTVVAAGYREDGKYLRSVRFAIRTDWVAAGVAACFRVDDVVNEALKQFSGIIANVLWFSISCAGAKMVCYVATDSPFLTFRFRNMHNVPEDVDVSGVVVAKSTTDSETALVGRRRMQYDRKLSKSYQVSTGPLDADQAAVLEQMLASWKVLVKMEDGNYEQVIITDSSCEVSTDDDTLTSFKFTWEFADSRPRVFRSPVFGILPDDRGIFTNQFTDEYV